LVADYLSVPVQGKTFTYIKKKLMGHDLCFGSVCESDQNLMYVLGRIGSSNWTCVFRLVPNTPIFGRSVLVQSGQIGISVCWIEYRFFLLLGWSVWICPNRLYYRSCKSLQGVKV
jgi:hypothetical protein